MKKTLIVMIIASMGLIQIACTQGGGKTLSGAAYPEEVYVVPEHNFYRNAKVGVLPFADPYYARGAGKNAASILCRQLEKNGVFARTILLSDAQSHDFLNGGKQAGYDLIITGNILYWFDGSTLEPSRVEQEIVVIKPSSKSSKVLWKARLSETGWPTQPKDLLLVQTTGAPAPSAMALLQKNSEKFCNLLMAGGQ